jgi:hypothetical protein
VTSPTKHQRRHKPKTKRNREWRPESASRDANTNRKRQKEPGRGGMRRTETKAPQAESKGTRAENQRHATSAGTNSNGQQRRREPRE